MYPIAVKQGIASDEYWEKTLEEILVQVEANREKESDGLKIKANLDYRMAQMMMYAVNDPQAMPEFEKIYPFASDEEQLTEEVKEMQEMQQEQQYMMMLAEQIKATRARKNKE